MEPQQQQPEQQHKQRRLSGDSRFSCNICLDTVSDEPVVTLCGHVYCWSCLFQWLKPGLTLAEQAELGIQTTFRNNHTDASRRVCPTCKSSCSVRHVIPIYVRGDANEDNENNDESAVSEHRAEGLRRRTIDGGVSQQSDSTDNPSTRIQPSQEAENPIPRRETVVSSLHVSLHSDIPRRPTRLRHHHDDEVRLSTPISASLSHGMFPLPPPAAADYDGATEYLSRLLLLLGSFVVLCLLVFP